MRLKSFLHHSEVVRVQFVPPKVETHIVGRYPGRTATEVRVEDFVAGAGVVGQEPFVEGYGLLGGGGYFRRTLIFYTCLKSVCVAPCRNLRRQVRRLTL